MVQAERIVAEARTWIGTPYQHQASCRGVGADCLGLVRGVYYALYGQALETPPPYAAYAQAGEEETLWQAAQDYLLPASLPPRPGQVMLFRLNRYLPARHLAIASEPERMIHALSGAHVCEVRLTPWWRRHCVACFSFPLPKRARDDA